MRRGKASERVRGRSDRGGGTRDAIGVALELLDDLTISRTPDVVDVASLPRKEARAAEGGGGQ